MKRYLILISVLCFISFISMAIYSNVFNSINESSEGENSNFNSSKSFYDLNANDIEGKKINFSDYKGKKVLIVNVASKCGYTPQYEDLQWLHDNYKDKLVILAFPSNNFARQEPGSNTEIVEFCKLNYGVTFQMFEKIEVRGNDVHPVYQWLSSSELNGWNDKSPKWNFYKYLIDHDGNLKKVLASSINPRDDLILDFIKSTYSE